MSQGNQRMRLTIVYWIGVTLATSPARADTLGYWKCDDGQTAEHAVSLVSVCHSPDVDGRAEVHQKGTTPVFDADVLASTVWDGATCSLANRDNRAALRFTPGDVSGAGSPVGGQVAVSGASPILRPASFTIELFVKQQPQMPRHAILASKRRRDRDGASWSLSIDPQGSLRSRFDTQSPGGTSTEGAFNQTFGSTGNLADGQWHHVALTFDHATLKAELFVDHLRRGGGVVTAALVYDDGDLIFGRGLCGWIDEVRLSDEVLHPEQFLRPARFFSDLKPAVRPLEVMLDQTPTRVQTNLRPGLVRIGTLRPKSVRDIETSRGRWDARRWIVTWPTGMPTRDISSRWGSGASDCKAAGLERSSPKACTTSPGWIAASTMPWRGD